MASAVVHFEIGGRDLDVLSSFYKELFGWEAVGFDADYRMVHTGEGIGGGLMRCRGEMPPYVTFYVAVEDIEATLRSVAELGGTVLVQPSPIPDVGSYALFLDPEGHAIGLLQPSARQDGAPRPGGASVPAEPRTTE